MVTTTNPQSVGVIGVGFMGEPMARNLAHAGHQVSAWHRSPEKISHLPADGVALVDTARELAAQNDFLLMMLPDLPQLREVLEGESGLLAGIDHPITLIISSTSSPTGVQELAQELHDRTGGLCQVVDAPVSGGRQGAIDAKLAIFVGGSKEIAAPAIAVLEGAGTPIYLGPLGSGQVVKACNQMIVASTFLALAEATVMAERVGVDIPVMLDILGQGLVSSRILEQSGHRFIEKNYDPSGPAKYMEKDLGFALDIAKVTQTSVPLSTALKQAYSDLNAKGFGDQDISVVQAYISQLRS